MHNKIGFKNLRKKFTEKSAVKKSDKIFKLSFTLLKQSFNKQFQVVIRHKIVRQLDEKKDKNHKESKKSNIFYVCIECSSILRC